MPGPLAIGGALLGAGFAADWLSGLPERYGIDSLSPTRQRIKGALQSELPIGNFEDQNLALQKLLMGNERQAVGSMQSYGAAGRAESPRSRAITDQFLLSKISEDFGEELSRIARTSAPGLAEMAARMGVDPSMLTM